MRKGSQNFVGQEENAGNLHFPFFPQCFLPFLSKSYDFSNINNFLRANSFRRDKSEVLESG